jgi:hypothetical protein
MRWHSRWASGLALLLVMSGCGGRNPSRNPPTRSAAEEEGERALGKIPPEDRLAFVQIGAAVGSLKSSATLIRLEDNVRPRDTLILKRLDGNVRRLRPRDPLLRRLRRWTATELVQAVEARKSIITARRSVQATLAGAQRILSGLRAYVFVHPEVQGLVPE